MLLLNQKKPLISKENLPEEKIYTRNVSINKESKK